MSTFVTDNEEFDRAFAFPTGFHSKASVGARQGGHPLAAFAATVLAYSLLLSLASLWSFLTLPWQVGTPTELQH